MDKPLSQLCDSIRHSTTRYALTRRILIGLAARLKSPYRSEMHSTIDSLDDQLQSIEQALSLFCSHDDALHHHTSKSINTNPSTIPNREKR